MSMILPDDAPPPASPSRLSREATIVVDSGGCVQQWDEAAEAILGWTPQEATGRKFHDLVPMGLPDSPEPNGVSEARPQGIVFETVARDGAPRLCESHITSSGDGGPRTLTIRDITGRRHADREQDRLRAIAAAVNEGRGMDEILLLVREAFLDVGDFDRVGVWLIDHDALRGAWGTDDKGRLRDERALSFRLDELAPLGGLRDPDRGFELRDSEFVQAAEVFQEYFPERAARLALGLRAFGTLTGVVFADNLISGRSIHESDVVALMPFCEQVSMALANARLLAEREQGLRRQQRLMEISAAINASVDLDTILRLVRDAVVEAGGFDRAGVWLVEREVIRGSWGTDAQGNRRDERHIEETYEDWSPLALLLRDGTRRYFLDRQDRGIINRLGEPCVPHAVLALVTGGELVGLLSVDNMVTGRDFDEDDVLPLMPFADQAAVAIQNARLISELRQAQEALVRSEKMRAIGELASGVAHNVNNVLTAVLGYAELIGDMEEAPAPARQYARIIERAALDGAEIARRMQQFARQETDDRFTPFDLAAVASEAIALTRPAWHSQAAARGVRVEVQSDLPDDLHALGVATEIREVAVNIIKNAAEAMPDGGTLTVRCFADRSHAVLEVSDTGLGMDEATARRVFEPFFTTKGTGLGMGLGLSLAWGIVSHHKGRITVDSSPGEGATFTVRIPLATSAAQSATLSCGRADLSGARVLLVEDEEIVAESLARTLVARGVQIAMAESADEALSWLRANGGACDLVLTDHGMAGMTGAEMLKRVRDDYPSIRRVLISGWGASLPAGADASAAHIILSKPVRQDELIESLRHVLSRE